MCGASERRTLACAAHWSGGGASETAAQAAEVAAPDQAQDERTGELAEPTAEPPGKAQLLLPREAGGPAQARRCQREPSDAGHETLVDHPDRTTRRPLG